MSSPLLPHSHESMPDPETSRRRKIAAALDGLGESELAQMAELEQLKTANPAAFAALPPALRISLGYFESARQAADPERAA